MYTAIYDRDWPAYFNCLDNETRNRVIKKIEKLLEYPYKRHLRGKAKYFVDEVGQYRIAYDVFENAKEVHFYFVGKHKDYEKFYNDFS